MGMGQGGAGRGGGGGLASLSDASQSVVSYINRAIKNRWFGGRSYQSIYNDGSPETKRLIAAARVAERDGFVTVTKGLSSYRIQLTTKGRSN